jgi:general transcription factor 3C polypeptide 3 (transcription factor C subunit 4)
MLIVLNQNDYQAKLARAKLYYQTGYPRRARNDCEALLKMNPVDGDVVQMYGKVCVDMDDAEVALTAFEGFITYCTEKETSDTTKLTWTAIASYVDILIQLEEYDKALKKFKSLTRWILGRGVETFWDDYDDDREWDPYPDPRRKSARHFQFGKFDEDTYGLGLPIEFRVRLGRLRILNSDPTDSTFQEGLNHLEYLFPSEEEKDESWQIEDYAELYKEAGDSLRESGNHLEALRFYEPLKSIADLLDSRFYFDLAICYQALDRQDDVRAALDHIRYGENNPMAQIGLAKLYQAKGRLDLMWRLCLELKRRNLHELMWKEGLPITRPKGLTDGNEDMPKRPTKGDKWRPRVAPKNNRVSARKQAESLRDILIRAMYDQLKSLEEAMKHDTSAIASDEWIRIAAELFEEFRNQKRFFPRDKNRPYMGSTHNRELRLEMTDILNPKSLEFEQPKEWRSIPLDEWAEVLAHYALALADRNKEECWEVISVSENATIIYPEPQRYQLIRVTSLRE